MKPTDASRQDGAPRDRPRADRRTEGRITSNSVHAVSAGHICRLSRARPSRRSCATSSSRDFNEHLALNHPPTIHGLAGAVIKASCVLLWTICARPIPKMAADGALSWCLGFSVWRCRA